MERPLINIWTKDPHSWKLVTDGSPALPTAAAPPWGHIPAINIGGSQSSWAAPLWGHTPAINIGGNSGDKNSSNTWNTWRSPPNSGSNSKNFPDSNPSNSNAMYGGTGPQSHKHWGGSQSSWTDGACGSESGSGVWDGSNKCRPISNWSPIATPQKEMGNPCRWEPTSPPPNRRSPPKQQQQPGGSFDDGTTVWGNPQWQDKVSHWKVMPPTKPTMNLNNITCPNGMMGNLGGMPPTVPGQILTKMMKPLTDLYTNWLGGK